MMEGCLELQLNFDKLPPLVESLLPLRSYLNFHNFPLTLGELHSSAVQMSLRLFLVLVSARWVDQRG